MNAVGKLGSYISKSVYTVSTPFHPFGGAVDIIVVKQQDDSFKSSPWYVRFGKFQGVLKAKEKVVKICVNGVEKDFHMNLENDGQACFLREVDVENGENLDNLSSPPSWDDETIGVANNTRLTVKSKSCDFESVVSVSTAKIDMGNENGDGDGVVRAKSHRSGILGYVFGRKSSIKEGGVSENEKGGGVKDDHLERAEMAADLLEVKWSTNCDSPNCVKENNASKLDVSKENDNNSKGDLKNDSKESIHDQEHPESDVTSSNTPMDNEAYSPPVYSHPINGSHEEEVEGQSIFAISSSHEAQLEKSSSTNDDKSNEHEHRPLEPDRFCSFHSTVTSVSYEEDDEDEEEEQQLLFGDLDDLSANNEKNTSNVPSDNEEKHDESHVPCYDLNSSSNEYDQCDQPVVVGDGSKMTTVASNVDIPVNCEAQADKIPRMAISLPNMWSHEIHFSSRLDDHQSSEISQRTEDASITQEPSFSPAEPETGDLSLPTDGSGGSQRTWSFSFKRARSAIPPQPPSQNNNGKIGTKSLPKDIGGSVGEDLPKVTKKIVRALTPTSEQLESLNLKEGKNEVVFTFSTQMLGEQKVDAQIYLWKWDMRIVISDVDGTITRSDVLGQFMPLMGVDWSQTGVVHLFSAIKENGYQMLFLSARSISQAYITRQFLVNLMQEGKGMPEGPVIISPDGLFPSLFREVVRRAPHEFKIACLEDIKALFPSDRNPFYAGFGNRDTDEISYLKVGIPKGKIFIINPKGEIVVNRHITNTKSYTSLQVLVNGVFPDFTSSEQQEDFNSFNFWRLPPPTIPRV